MLSLEICPKFALGLVAYLPMFTYSIGTNLVQLKGEQMPRLTKSIVDGITANEKTLTIWDQGVGSISGFCVEAYASGRKTYYYLYRMKGSHKKKRIKLGVHGSITCEIARELAQGFAGDVARGIDPYEKIQQGKEKTIEDSKDILFKDFLDLFTERHRKVYHKPVTFREDNYRYKNHILPFFGNQKINNIS